MASRTTGFSGANLENLINMAAIRASIEGWEVVGMAEFEYSYNKVASGRAANGELHRCSDCSMFIYVKVQVSRREALEKWLV